MKKRIPVFRKDQKLEVLHPFLQERIEAEIASLRAAIEALLAACEPVERAFMREQGRWENLIHLPDKADFPVWATVGDFRLLISAVAEARKALEVSRG